MSIEHIPSNTTLTYNNDKVRAQTNKVNDEIKMTNNEIPRMKLRENDEKISEEKLKGMVEGLNDFLQPTHTSLKFELHEKLKEYYVTIVDETSKEVIREIPSKKLLDMYAAMTEFLGFVVDRKI
ncbi:flagellar protein FlaG [Cytobacillus sp. S13-E01]|uniref:flagellar protein FlaG n=1 Tax=Cytobacillus sp. S13-E01 TaxID=3031326 RepID=UPI0023D7D4E6|nr:flagellar protein FlaG [Cytobacillus sp. S13-E01]MDF0726081.1 flagellar protein FlaG [Cytobacillus sp. S13-E01]